MYPNIAPRVTRSVERLTEGYVSKVTREELILSTYRLVPHRGTKTIGKSMVCALKIGERFAGRDNAPSALKDLLDEVSNATESATPGKSLEWIRGHLLNGQLGGAGTDPKNLVMLTKKS